MRASWNGVGHRVEAMRAAGAASDDAGEAHPAAGPEPVFPDRIAGEFGTGGRMAAIAAHEGRESLAVELDERVGDELEGIVDHAPEGAREGGHGPHQVMG